jgi:hypothetical protein
VISWRKSSIDNVYGRPRLRSMLMQRPPTRDLLTVEEA